MSKKACIGSMVINSLWAAISAFVAIKFGMDAEFGVKTILMDLQYNVPWNVIIRQSFIPGFMMNVVITAYSITNLFAYANDALDAAWRLIHRSKEEKDAEQFIKWMKKEQKRLRKLEGTY